MSQSLMLVDDLSLLEWWKRKRRKGEKKRER
jgi:hypothetical protein